MPLTKANGIDIFYDEFGDKSDPALLLIMGLGTQMIAWSEDFCRMLSGEGFRVIRFDNRDIGLSQKMDKAPRFSLPWAFIRFRLGWTIRSPYSLEDMAADAIGLLDALKIERAHIVGASMGGMIAQIIAACYPQRCLSLTSIMSTSGEPNLPHPKPQAMAALREKRPPANDREAMINFGMKILRAIGSPGYPSPEPELRAAVTSSFDRSVYPAGFVRQMLAILANGSRSHYLKAIRTPTLVLHGEDDPLVPIEGGRDTHRRIAGSAMETIAGWGHDLPTALLPRLAASITAHCKRATA